MNRILDGAFWLYDTRSRPKMVTICRVFELERTPKCFPVYLPIGMQSSGSQLVKLWVYSDFLSLLRAHTTPRPTGH